VAGAERVVDEVSFKDDEFPTADHSPTDNRSMLDERLEDHGALRLRPEGKRGSVFSPHLRKN
jgi:hypothetical protein